MHHVQAPKQRHGVKRPVLKIDDEIEDEDGGDDGEPPRGGDEVEQAEAQIFSGYRGNSNTC